MVVVLSYPFRVWRIEAACYGRSDHNAALRSDDELCKGLRHGYGIPGIHIKHISRLLDIKVQRWHHILRSRVFYQIVQFSVQPVFNLTASTAAAIEKEDVTLSASFETFGRSPMLPSWREYEQW